MTPINYSLIYYFYEAQGMIEIAILDDENEYAEKFKAYFNEDSEFRCVFSASSIQSLWQELEKTKTASLKFMLLDIILVGESGLEVVAKLNQRFPHVQLVMLTCIENSEMLIKAISSGASGYLIKTQTFEEIKEYLRIATKGGAALSGSMARKLVAYFRPREHSQGQMGPRTLQVLHFLAEGWSYKMIANNMGITVDGVRFHIKTIYRVLNVQSKPQAVRKYLDEDY
ncbi:MAG: DNA-binding response regulator [Runella slithyformis]|nr:MAG: DNA-binding response regulator [Runella slithyformis]TAF80940.1 MAG: DNA-binding response regulator [Runella slithyformis]